MEANFGVQAKHANGEHSWGVNGETGKIVDMKEYGLYESASVKVRLPCFYCIAIKYRYCHPRSKHSKQPLRLHVCSYEWMTSYKLRGRRRSKVGVGEVEKRCLRK